MAQVKLLAVRRSLLVFIIILPDGRQTVQFVANLDSILSKRRQAEACRTSSSMLEIVGSRRRFVRPFAARRSLAARPLLAFALDQIRLFLLEHFALLEIFVAIEVDLAFDRNEDLKQREVLKK